MLPTFRYCAKHLFPNFGVGQIDTRCGHRIEGRMQWEWIFRNGRDLRENVLHRRRINSRGHLWLKVLHVHQLDF